MRYNINRILKKIKSYNYKNLSYALLICVLTMSVLGINVIGSATANYTDSTSVKKQILGMILGVCLMIIFGLLDYRFLLRFHWLIYAFTIIMLASVQVIGSNYNGAQRWIDFKVFQFQPSEIAKVLLILFLAQFISKNKEKFNSIKVLSLCTLFTIGVTGLIYIQPDLSTSIVIIGIFVSIMFIAGISWKVIVSVISCLIPICVILLYLLLQPDQKILDDYQYNRLIGFYDSDNKEAAAVVYQQENSVMAIGSGGLWGKGLYNDSDDSVKNGNYLSEAETDFIFTIIGEELGFVGTIFVVTLMLITVILCFFIGSRAPDFAGKIICGGFGSLIAIQAFINMGVAVEIIPNTGLPLPFISSGVTSLLSMFMGVGLVLNVSLQRKKTI